MNLVVLVWSMAVALCLTSAWVYGLIWWQQRRDTAAYLLFAAAAISTATMAAMELWMQLAKDPQEYRLIILWAYVPFTLIFLTLTTFVRLYLRAGRNWLFWSIMGLRVAALALNFSGVQKIDYERIVTLEHIPFLGGSVVFPPGTIRPTVLVGLLGQVLALVYFADATFAVWRRGNRRQSLVVGGGILVFTTGALVHILLLNWRVVVTPVMPSLYFTGIMVMMGIELSYLVAQSNRATKDLLESQLRISLAKSTAKFALWTLEIPSGSILFSSVGRVLHRLPAESKIRLEVLLASFAEPDRDRMRQAFNTAVAVGNEVHTEGRIESPEGAERWFALHGKVVPADGSNPQRMLGLSLDITERKRAEIAVQQSAAFNQTVLDSLSSNLAVLDRRGIIIAFNRNWERFYINNGGDHRTSGIGANYLVACQSAADVGILPSQKSLDGIRAVLEGRSDFFELEYSCDAPDEARWFLLRAVPLQSAAGGAVVSHTNITTLKRAMRDKEQLSRELEHSGRVSLLGELSGSLAHELNQPLAAILSNAQAAQRWMGAGNPDLEEIKAILADIVAEDKRAGQIVHRVRALARKETPERESLDLNQLVEDSAALVRSDCVALNMKLSLNLACDLPRVRGGQIELQQVLLNLLLNGMQAQENISSEQRGLLVTTRHENGQVCVGIRDCGPGVPEESRARIFEAFYTTKHTGLGLGLAFCRRTAENHGGGISVENHPEGGAVLTVRLPVEAKVSA